MGKYPIQPNAKIDNEVVKFSCCDCGLVHCVGINVDPNGIFYIALARDDRATGQIRRGKAPSLMTPMRRDKWEMVRRA